MPAPVFSVLSGLARKENIRQRLSIPCHHSDDPGGKVVAPDTSPHYADAESDTPAPFHDRNRPSREKIVKIKGKTALQAMHGLQHGVAILWIALHLQQDYLAVMEQRCFSNEQF
jgi:hypothetical protein